MSQGEDWLRSKVAQDPSFAGRANHALEQTSLGLAPSLGLDAYFQAIVERGIRESKWFRTAPVDYQATATIKMIGIEERKYRGLGGHARMRPALVAECECGGETQRFSLLLDNTESVEAID